MDSMDNCRARIEALEQQTEQWHQPTRRVERQRRGWRSPWWVAALLTLGLVLAQPDQGQAKTFHCGAGDVACLLDAIKTANADGDQDTIRLEAGTYTLTAPNDPEAGGGLRTGLPVITSPLRIIGAGADTTVIERDARADRFRLLRVAPTGTLTLRAVTLHGGSTTGAGGGIRNEGTLTLSHTTVANSGSLGTGGASRTRAR
jgi:hypothetical protein